MQNAYLYLISPHTHRHTYIYPKQQERDTTTEASSSSLCFAMRCWDSRLAVLRAALIALLRAGRNERGGDASTFLIEDVEECCRFRRRHNFNRRSLSAQSTDEFRVDCRRPRTRSTSNDDNFWYRPDEQESGRRLWCCLFERMHIPVCAYAREYGNVYMRRHTHERLSSSVFSYDGPSRI